jgi:hypothetical protein
MSRSPKTSTRPSTVFRPHILPDGKSGRVEPMTARSSEDGFTPNPSDTNGHESARVNGAREQTYPSNAAEPLARSAVAVAAPSHRQLVAVPGSIVRDESSSSRSARHCRANRTIGFGSRSLPHAPRRSRGGA